jgi:hypothetical protein
MNVAVFLLAFGIAGAGSSGASAASAPVVPTPPEPQRTTTQKRKAADYGGYKTAAPSPGSVVLWIPRLVLAPLYLVTEYVIRAPLSVVVPAAERADLPRVLEDFFLFGPNHKAGILPAGFLSFGLNPSVGVYGFWHDALAAGNDWSARAEV